MLDFGAAKVFYFRVAKDGNLLASEGALLDTIRVVAEAVIFILFGKISAVICGGINCLVAFRTWLIEVIVE